MPDDKPLLDEKTVELLDKEFSTLKNPVKILIFTGGSIEPGYEKQALGILKEISSIPSAKDKINLIEKTISSNDAEAGGYGIFAIGTPAITLIDYSGGPSGIIFHGVPGGYEFRTFIDTIKMISDGDSGLKPETRSAIAGLKNFSSFEIKIFVTLTCPYCPQAVKLSERFAYESKGKIISRVIDASAFEDMAVKYNIFSVPHIVINETDRTTGAPTEDELLERIKNIASK